MTPEQEDLAARAKQNRLTAQRTPTPATTSAKPKGKVPIPLTCIDLLEPLGQSLPCPTCLGTVPVPLRGCRTHGTCTETKLVKDGDGKPVPCCAICNDRRTAPPVEVAPTPPVEVAATVSDAPCGVVIGSWGWPALAELQIRLIRQTCGPVPILVSDDKPDTADSDALRRICAAFPDVMHWPNAENIGHTGGDIACYFKGVVWGASRGLRVVAKLSQRFLVDRPRWLQEGAAELLASGLPLATRECTGRKSFPLRSEAALLHVEQWNKPDVLSRIVPRRYWRDAPMGLNAETILMRLLEDTLGGIYWPWSLFTGDRHARTPGVIWHHTHAAEEYHALAERMGVKLSADFHADGWQRERARGEYAYG